VIAASVNGQTEAEAAYHHIATDYAALLKESADYYRNYLTTRSALNCRTNNCNRRMTGRGQRATGLVTNPSLGTGLIAGYRTSGGGQRPGFAWFFGRDAL